jgi:DNA-binding CsgD family transcriptional regulator
MEIVYKFNVGTVSKVEVDEEIGKYILASRKEEHANNEKKRSHCISLDALKYEGSEYASKETVETVLIDRSCREQLYEVIEKLTDVQKRRLEMLLDGHSLREIARQEGVNLSKIQKSVAQIQKKFHEFC